MRSQGQRISGNPAINDFLQQQEKLLQELINTIEKPFFTEREYMKWHRQAVALQLSQTTSNDFYINNRALWENLLKSEHNDKEKREWVVIILHNFLEITFSQARIELSIREGTGTDPL